MSTLMKQLFFVCLLLAYLPVSAQEYAIAGVHTDGNRIGENDVLFVNDTGSFRIIKNGQEPVSMQSAVWRMEGLKLTMEITENGIVYDFIYVPLLEESTNPVYDFNLAEDNLLNKYLQGWLIGDDNHSAYFKAKVICSGKTADNVDIELELPLLLNFLPGRPEFEIIDYNLTGTSPYVQLKYTTERTDRLELMDMVFPHGKYGDGHGMIFSIPLQSDNYLYYTNTRYQWSEYRQQFLYLMAHNSFGANYSDSIRIHELMTSIEDLSSKASFLVYPNPAHNYIYIQGVDIQNIKKLTILDAAGKTRKEVDVFATNKIDVSGLPQGIYILRIEHKNNHKKEHIKLIKK